MVPEIVEPGGIILELFWIIIFIGYFLFKALGKKLPEMMEDFPGGWQLPGTQQDTDGQEINGVETGQPKGAAAVNRGQGSDSVGRKTVSLETERYRDETSRVEGLLEDQPGDQPEDRPAAIDFRDVVNGIIMSEVLQPPLARRKKR